MRHIYSYIDNIIIMIIKSQEKSAPFFSGSGRSFILDFEVGIQLTQASVISDLLLVRSFL